MRQILKILSIYFSIILIRTIIVSGTLTYLLENNDINFKEIFPKLEKAQLMNDNNKLAQIQSFATEISKFFNTPIRFAIKQALEMNQNVFFTHDYGAIIIQCDNFIHSLLHHNSINNKMVKLWAERTLKSEISEADKWLRLRRLLREATRMFVNNDFFVFRIRVKSQRGNFPVSKSLKKKNFAEQF